MCCMRFVGDFLSSVNRPVLCSKMDMNTDLNAVNEKQLQVEETDDSCRVDFIEIVPLTRDTDGSCHTECVSGDWFGEVREIELADLKQEPDYVCCILCLVFILSHYYKEFVQILGNRSTFVSTCISVVLIRTWGGTAVV